MAADGDTIQAAAAHGNQETAVRVKQELPEMCKPDPEGEHVTHRQPKTEPWEGAGVEAKKPSLRRLFSVGELLENGHLASSSAAPVPNGVSTKQGGVPGMFWESSSTAPVTTRVSPKQSGVPGVYWHSRDRRWTVQVHTEALRLHRSFYVCKYFKLGMSEEDASNAALEAAIAFRRGLEASGTGTMGQQARGCPSGKPDVTRGVCWDKKYRSWYVRIQVKGKSIHGGYFKPKDDSPEEKEKVRILALECRRALERKHWRVETQFAEGSKEGRKRFRVETQGAEGSKEGRKRDIQKDGVFWNKQRSCWQTRIAVKGKRIHGGCFRPKDDSPKEMQKARILALECRRAMEQRYRDTESSA